MFRHRLIITSAVLRPRHQSVEHLACARKLLVMRWARAAPTAVAADVYGHWQWLLGEDARPWEIGLLHAIVDREPGPNPWARRPVPAS